MLYPLLENEEAADLELKTKKKKAAPRRKLERERSAFILEVAERPGRTGNTIEPGENDGIFCHLIAFVELHKDHVHN